MLCLTCSAVSCCVMKRWVLIVEQWCLSVSVFHSWCRVQWVLCMSPTFHGMTKPLHLQCCYLLMWWKGRCELLMDVFCVFSFFCHHFSYRVSCVICLISMIHSMMLLLYLQCIYWSPHKNLHGEMCSCCIGIQQDQAITLIYTPSNHHHHFLFQHLWNTPCVHVISQQSLPLTWHAHT